MKKENKRLSGFFGCLQLTADHVKTVFFRAAGGMLHGLLYFRGAKLHMFIEKAHIKELHTIIRMAKSRKERLVILTTFYLTIKTMAIYVRHSQLVIHLLTCYSQYGSHVIYIK